MKFDQYTLNARIYPAVLCVIPIIIMVLVIDDPILSKLLSDVIAIQIIGKFGICVAAFFLLMQLVRTLGKDLFERLIFSDELYFPTTEYLMPHCTELSEEFKVRIAAKAMELFRLELPTEELCKDNESVARRQARDVVASIRGAVGKPSLLLQRNWEYGFYRNLAGGSPISLVASIVGAYWNANSTVGYVFIVLAITYLLIIILSRWLLRRTAGHYAQQLFYAFLGDER